MHPAGKKLNEMNRLADLLHFPAAVNAGATLNVLVTTTATWFLVPRWPQPWAPILWIAMVLTLNLLPVALLRLSLTPRTRYPTLAAMSFLGDQHKFSDWVYVAASANMAFWTLSAWATFSVAHSLGTLVTVLAVEALVTFAPVLFGNRRHRRR